MALRSWRHGFLPNITNPKVLVFYLAVLPQFLTPGTGIPEMVLFALSHAALSALYLLLLVASPYRARRLLARRGVRRSLDRVAGAALLGFGTRLAADRSERHDAARRRSHPAAGSHRPDGLPGPGRGPGVASRTSGRRRVTATGSSPSSPWPSAGV